MNIPTCTLSIFFYLGMLCVTQAACVNSVVNPTAAPRSAWNDLLSIKPDKSLNKYINFVQLIDTNGAGEVNLDFYSITIDAGAITPADIMVDLRKNISQYIYKTGNYKVEPLNLDSATTWAKADPKGAVMVFTLAAFGPIPVERGAVVVSCADATSFVFSTINIGGLFSGAQDHPVAGNRGFGVIKNVDGSVTIFTKAADRRKSDNIVFAQMGSADIFKKGAEVWKGLLANLEASFASRKPRGKIAYSRQEAW